MPTLDDLNEVKRNLLEIGNETEILAAKGETPVDIGPPETGISDDLNALFDGFSDVEEDESKIIDKDPDIAGIDDFDFDLDEDEPLFDMDGFDPPEDVGIGIDDPDTPDPEQDVPTEPPVDLSDEDLVSDPGFDDLDADLGDLDTPDPEQFDTPPDLEQDGFTEAPVELSDEDLVSDLGFDDLDADPGDLDTPDSEQFDTPPDLEQDVPTETPVDLSDEDLVSDLGFDDLDADPGDLDTPDPEQFDELTVPPVEGVPEQFDELTVPPVEGEESVDGGFEDLLGAGVEETETAESLEEEVSLDSDADFILPDEEPLEIDEDDFNLDESLDFDLSGDDSEDFSIPDDGSDPDPGDDSLSGSEDDVSLDLDEFDLDDDLDEDLEIDEFNLGDLGQDFGVLEDDISESDEIDLSSDTGSTDEFELEEDEFELSEEAFDRVKASLLKLPLNLKIIIEELIGEKNLKGAPLEKLLTALAEGKPPKDIAAITSKITGKKIKIPSNYEKRTGLDFEEEKGSFQYTFIHNIIPLLKIFAISVVIISGLSFIGYKYIYVPVSANILYNKGWKELEKGNYALASDYFDEAFKRHSVKKQFYRFADGYQNAEQFTFAREQYDMLLEYYRYDKKGTIDYATMEFEKALDFEHSTELLENFLQGTTKDKRDYDALLLLGDINLEWGLQDKTRLEDARLAYAKIMNTYGITNTILFRMLRYFIRTDNAREVEILKKRFQADSELEIDPEAYAELAGYQIDRSDISDVQELLFRAKAVDDDLPEIHYNLARLFNITEESGEEDKALTNTLTRLKRKEPLGRKYIEIKIDTLRRTGERFYIKEEYVQAEEAYQQGIELLEKSRIRNLIPGHSRAYGQLYADLGNIYYFISEDLDIAYGLYEKAEGEGLFLPEIYYNKGYIRYRKGDYREALLEFYNAAGSFSTNSNLLFATGNTLLLRNDYFAAQGYYNHLLDILESQLNREFIVDIEKRKDQRLMVEKLMRAYNNMGVVLYRLSRTTGDPSKFSAAMVSFTRSAGYFDDLTRDQETMRRTETINLAALNQRELLYPTPDYDLQIFLPLSKSLSM